MFIRKRKTVNLIKGASILKSPSLKEGYKVEKNLIQANVSSENIMEVIKKFIEINKKEPLFLFLEIPTNLKEEEVKWESNHQGILEKMHIDIYYLDGLRSDELKNMIDSYSEILLHDGLIAFGVGSNLSNEEIGKYKYNIMNAYFHEENLLKYKKMFEDLGIKECTKLKTAWDFISSKNPGTSERYEINGKTIYDVLEELKLKGLYKADRREN